MAEVLGAVSAATALAEQGLKLFHAINDYVTAVKGAQNDIMDLAKQIELVSSMFKTLSQVLELEKSSDNKNGRLANADIYERVGDALSSSESIFTEVRIAIEETVPDLFQDVGAGRDVILKKFQKFVWPFKQNEVYMYVKKLDTAKANIHVGISSITLLHDIAKSNEERKRREEEEGRLLEDQTLEFQAALIQLRRKQLALLHVGGQVPDAKSFFAAIGVTHGPAIPPNPNVSLPTAEPPSQQHVDEQSSAVTTSSNEPKPGNGLAASEKPPLPFQQDDPPSHEPGQQPPAAPKDPNQGLNKPHSAPPPPKHDGKQQEHHTLTPLAVQEKRGVGFKLRSLFRGSASVRPQGPSAEVDVQTQSALDSVQYTVVLAYPVAAESDTEQSISSPDRRGRYNGYDTDRSRARARGRSGGRSRVQRRRKVRVNSSKSQSSSAPWEVYVVQLDHTYVLDLIKDFHKKHRSVWKALSQLPGPCVHAISRHTKTNTTIEALQVFPKNAVDEKVRSVHVIFRHSNENDRALAPQLSQRIYARVRARDVSSETLKFFDLPWEIDKHDPRYFIILKMLSQEEADVLFEHTRRLRMRKKEPSSSMDRLKEMVSQNDQRRRARSRSKASVPQPEPVYFQDEIPIIPPPPQSGTIHYHEDIRILPESISEEKARHRSRARKHNEGTLFVEKKGKDLRKEDAYVRRRARTGRDEQDSSRTVVSDFLRSFANNPQELDSELESDIGEDDSVNSYNEEDVVEDADSDGDQGEDEE